MSNRLNTNRGCASLRDFETKKSCSGNNKLGTCSAIAGKVRVSFFALWTLSFRRSILRSMTLSARNRIKGKVVEIQFGGVMAHVVIRAGKNLIESVITKRSADEMKLKVGDTVSAVIKSTEVMLEKN
jgi:molybdopterin-binding protein